MDLFLGRMNVKKPDKTILSQTYAKKAEGSWQIAPESHEDWVRWLVGSARRFGDVLSI